MCKMEKVTNFTQFEQKITYISGCKLVYKYTIATVTMYICTVTVACVFNILIIFSLSLSLLSPHLTHPFPHLLSLSPISLSSCLHCRRSNHASIAANHQTLTLTSFPFPHASATVDQTMPPLPSIIKPLLSLFLI